LIDPSGFDPLANAEGSGVFSEGFRTDGFRAGLSCWLCSIPPKVNKK
jgi:hypothetical protein